MALSAIQIQTILKSRDLYPGLLDGLLGKQSRAGIDTALNKLGLNISGWVDVRRQIAFEQSIYKEAGIEVGTIDGLVGEQTRYAREVYESRAKGSDAAETWRDKSDASVPVLTNAGNSWPKQSESEMTKFFGGRGQNQVILDMPFPLRIAWEPARTTTRVSCNAKCRDAFSSIWTKTLAHYGIAKVQELRLDMFGGCLNVRKMRGGSAWSIHSWGCAWDIDPDRNQLKWKRNLASLDDPPYAPFWQIVASEGGVGLGPARDFDWMHYQFARL